MRSSDLGRLAPQTYSPHALHTHERSFRETNCYVDLVIEAVHALGLEPVACLGFTLETDFEGDQWTFFKPKHAALEALYGLRIEELALFRPLLDHLSEQVARGRIPLCEVDAYCLPDTAGSDYRTAHTKTTIGVTHIDPQARTLRYFHNAGLYELSGDDFDGLLRPPIAAQVGYLPPFCEILKAEHAIHRPEAELRVVALGLLRDSVARRPAANPLSAYGASFPEHVQRIAAGGMPAYHAYSFAGLRQLGASFELAAVHLRWLDGADTNGPHAQAAAAFDRVAATAKTLILKLARVAMSARSQDFSTSFAQMSQDWQLAMDSLGGPDSACQPT
jgi:hypothetical protein